MWQQLLQRIEIVQPPSKPQKKPTRKDMAECEKSLGFHFPESYKSFVRQIGAGEISEYFNIFAPGYSEKRSGSLEALIDLVRKEAVSESLVEVYGDEAFVRRMIPFADTIGGDLFVWDPEDCRDDCTHEYGIFVFPDDRSTIIQMAASFVEFIDEVCLGDKFRLIAGPSWCAVSQFTPF